MVHIKKLVLKGFKSFAKETPIDFNNSMNVIVGPNGSGKSSCYDTRVLLSDGKEIEIGKLVEDKIKTSNNIKKLNDGVYVDNNDSTEIISLNIKTMKQEKKKISKYIRREGDTIYKIRTRMGKEIKATGCHPVIAFKDGFIKSTTINELSKKDIIATPRILNIDNGKDYDYDLARFLGYIIGDGYIAKDRIEFVNDDDEIIKDFKNIIINKLKLDFRERQDKNINKIYIRDKDFVMFIKNLFIKNYPNSITSSIKKIPDELMNINKGGIAHLLQGLYDTDGSVRKDIGIIEFCTKNRTLADQIQGLLLRFGIISKIKKRMCFASNTVEKKKREYYYLYIYGKENIEKFYSNINLKVKHKRENIETYLAKNLNSNTNIDILPKEINSLIKDLCLALGIKIKPLRKEHPLLSAYIENRCYPTRMGIAKLMPLFTQKFSKLQGFYSGIKLNQNYLVDCIKELNISGQEASKSIGMHPAIIMRDWATNKFNARTSNLGKFYDLINNSFEERLGIAESIINLLITLYQSDIFWDEIVSVQILSKEDFVYDLEIEENHNFIANNIFVHNSNITDAICFVLGRMSAKSMRASKASNMIFAGTKQYKPSYEASVKLVLDNSDKKLSIPEKEIEIERIVRRNKQTLYKINNQVKTRQEIIEVLGQVGIDPYGFNIILQGEIDSVVKMHGEERRKIIEEVAGISIYEIRKEKSLRELEKTDEKLKEVQTTLRERTAYLKNLEEERKQALRYKKLEEEIKTFKASILKRKLKDKEIEFSNFNQEQDKKLKLKEKEKNKEQEIRKSIENFEQEIEKINSQIQKSSGIEQESLNREISDLRAELAGLSVRKENSADKREELSARKERLSKEILSLKDSIQSLRKDFPSQTKKQKELENKRKELEEAEKEKKKFYQMQEKLNSSKEKLKDKEKDLYKNKILLSNVLKEIENISESLTYKELNICRKNIEKYKSELNLNEEKFESLSEKQKEAEKLIFSNEKEISNFESIKKQVSKLDICPLCKSKITDEHIKQVFSECDEKISHLKKEKQDKQLLIEKTSSEIKNLRENLSVLKKDIPKAEFNLITLENIEAKKEQLKNLNEQEKTSEHELEFTKNQIKSFEKQVLKYADIEERYDKIFLEIQDISARTEENVNAELELKERDFEKHNITIKQLERGDEDLIQELEEINSQIEENESALVKKESEEQELEKKFQKLIEKRNSMQKNIHENNTSLLQIQNSVNLMDNEINNFKVEIARINAEKQNLETDFEVFKEMQIINLPIYALEEKLNKTQATFDLIGSVNLRALEVYDKIKEEYDKIAEKVKVLDTEKLEIMKIVEEIDRKKKTTFFKTLKAVNQLFNRNFSELYVKGEAFLELENPEDPFLGGLDIVIKVGRGKYFDVHSLSGGERVLVALSLIFAIQEYKPYFFYIFDEVDAALDKRNSERLAVLIKRYMKTGQYIVVTHNDAIISESALLYGVSMQEGISKVLSLEV